MPATIKDNTSYSLIHPRKSN